MIPPQDRPRAVLISGLTVSLLLVLALGTDTVWLRLTESFPTTLRWSAWGVPPFLPGLRLNPRGDSSWAFTLAEDFAALLLLGTVALLLRRLALRHPDAGVGRRLVAGWSAVVAGGAVAGVFRGLALARMTGAAPLGWTAHPVAGALSGAGWGLLLGWTVGLVVAATSPSLQAAHGESHPASGMPRR